MAKKNTEIAPIDNFVIANRYEGIDDETMAELQDELDDLGQDSGIDCRIIKIPAGGGMAYEVQGDEDDDVEYKKEITGVIVFTHRLNGYWPFKLGTDDNNKIPSCSSMDGKTGIDKDTGEIRSCDTCPYNQFGSATDDKGETAKGKACKNMRRLYLMISGDPNFYLLTVPPTSIRDIEKKLKRIVSSGTSYAQTVISLKLEKATNAGGIAYSKVAIEKRGVLPPETAVAMSQIRKQLKAQYASMAITFDDYAPSAATAEEPAAPAESDGQSDFVEVSSNAPDLPFD